MITIDPYEAVDWDTVGRYKSEYHLHSYIDTDVAYLPHEMVDVLTGDGEDQNGNTMPVGEEYEVFGVIDRCEQSPIVWPWTDFESLDEDPRTDGQHDGDFENRDPSEVGPDGVIAVPGEELYVIDEWQQVEHVLSLFSTLDYHELEQSEVRERTDWYDQVLKHDNLWEPEPVMVIAHAKRYYDDPETDWVRYIEDFENYSLEDGLIGLEAVNKNANEGEDLVLWDRLLTKFAPDRMIFGIANDDAGRSDQESGVGLGFDHRFTVTLLHPSEFDPNDQDSSRQATVDAYKRGQMFFVERDSYNPDTEDPPQEPVVTDVTVDGNTITLDADHWNSIEWISKGEVVETGLEITVTEDDAPYVRAELKTNPGATTYTQPWGIEGGDVSAALYDAELNDASLGGSP